MTRSDLSTPQPGPHAKRRKRPHTAGTVLITMIETIDKCWPHSNTKFPFFLPGRQLQRIERSEAIQWGGVSAARLAGGEIQSRTRGLWRSASCARVKVGGLPPHVPANVITLAAPLVIVFRLLRRFLGGSHGLTATRPCACWCFYKTFAPNLSCFRYRCHFFAHVSSASHAERAWFTG